MEELLKWANGNLGTFGYLMSLLNPENALKGVTIIGALERMSIRGDDLHVLFSDLCNGDLDKVISLCKNCPKNILEDACSRQDYSGRELVKSYF